MNEHEEPNIAEKKTYPPKPEMHEMESNVWKTIISIALYAGFYLYFFNGHYVYVAILIAVLLLHEFGHFIAMKIYGYTDVTMLFIPFMGAFVSGETSNLSQFRRSIVLLAGPVPGIIVGFILFIIHSVFPLTFFASASAFFIFLNGFNLLPFSPMDGGQLVETFFTPYHRFIQRIFIFLFCLYFTFVALYFNKYFLIVPVLFGLYRLYISYERSKIQYLLDKEGLDYEQSYDDLTDEEYWRIRDIMILNMKQYDQYMPGEPHKHEEKLIPQIMAILNKPITKDVKLPTKIILCIIWALLLILSIGLLLIRWICPTMF